MRYLWIKRELADIDDKTAIGIDLQAYDLKEPGKLKVNVSNSFSIPATAVNLRILGNPGNPHRLNNTIYDKIRVDYQVNNTMYIENGSARIESIKDGRINMYVASRPTFVDNMKATPLNYFLKKWFNNEFENDNFSTFKDLVDNYGMGHKGVKLSPYISTPADLVDTEEAVPEYFDFFNGATYENAIALMVQNDIEGWNAFGGHFCIYIEPLFRYMESYFGVDIGSENEASYSLFKDGEFKKIYIPARNIISRHTMSGWSLQWIDWDGEVWTNKPLDFEPYEGLTAYDLFIETLKLLGYGVEDIGGKYELIRLDKIGLVPLKSDILPGYMEADFRSKMEYRPNIEGYALQNIIKMTPDSEAGELAGAKIVESGNKNTEGKADLFTVNAYVPYFRGLVNGKIVPDLRSDDACKKITFLKDSNELIHLGVCDFVDTITESDYPSLPRWLKKGINKVLGRWKTNTVYYTSLRRPDIYVVANEYRFLDDILTAPEMYKVKRWVTSSQMENFRKIATYYVPELGGWFYVNKIKGFNPVKSKQPVEFELIKVPWQRMPQLPEKPIEISDRWIFETGYWDDGGIWKDSENWAFN